MARPEPRQLGGRHAGDPFLAGDLGYRWDSAADVSAWRNLRGVGAASAHSHD